MRVVESFFPAGVGRTGAVFQAPGGYWVESRHRVPGVPTHWILPAEPLGHPDDRLQEKRVKNPSAARLPISAALKLGALRFLNP